MLISAAAAWLLGTAMGTSSVKTSWTAAWAMACFGVCLSVGSLGQASILLTLTFSFLLMWVSLEQNSLLLHARDILP